MLLALEASITKLVDPSQLLVQVENRLWADQVVDPADGGVWRVDGLTSTGGLRLNRGKDVMEWIRWP